MAQIGSVSTQLTRAQSALRRGAIAQAEEIYTEILGRYPGNRRAVAGLRALAARARPTLERAGVAYRAGRYEQALRLVDAVLQRSNTPTAQDLRAACLRGLGRFDEALTVYRASLDDRPTEAGLWLNCGAVLIDLALYRDARPCLEMAAQLDPDTEAHWQALAQCLDLIGDYEAAYDALTQTLARTPSNAVSLNLLGSVLRNQGKADLSEQAHRLALENAMDKRQRAAALNGLGIVAAAFGDPKEAEQRYRMSLGEDPVGSEACLNLARLNVLPPGDPVLRHLDRLADRDDLSLRDRSNIQFALFTALDHAGEDPAVCFDHLHRGNELRRACLPYRESREVALFDTIINRLSDLPRADAKPTESCPVPIFVTGLPRSGTTLTEQILAQTDGTLAAGEMPFVDNAAFDLLSRLEDEGRAITAGDVARVRDALIRDYTCRAQGHRAIVDKSPLNFRWIGLILAALPEARIVHVHRDPIETCWSNYKTSFAANGLKFAYGLESLVTYHRLYDRLIGHWAEIYGARILDLPYEALIGDLGAQTRRLTSFCDVPWSPACMSPETAGRAVLTASAQQVRQPVYNGNTQSWRRYTPYLTPLIEGLKNRNELASSLSKHHTER